MPDYTLEYVYTGAGVNWSPAIDPSNSVPNGTTFTLNGIGASASVRDDDGLLEDNNAGAPQTLDLSQQVLASAFGSNAAGDYVHSRGYYEIVDSLGNVGRLYQVRMGPWNYQGSIASSNAQYWAIAGDVVIDPSVSYTVRGTPASDGRIYLNGFGNVDYGLLTEPRCFAATTLIETETGSVAVEDLEVGDLVRTRDNGFKPVRWIESQALDAGLLAAMPHLRAIRIRAGALGAGLPRRDLCVSPQHRMTVRNTIVARMFDTEEVLVAAKHLLAVDGIEILPEGSGITYLHFLLDQHEIVFAEGAEAETLYTGPQALRTMSPESRAELFALFPELATLDHDALPARAGRFAEGRRARRLADRAARNKVSLIEG